MADITYTQFPIEADIVDISQMQTDISNAQTDILNLGQNKADKTTTINGYSLASNRTLYAQDIPSKNLLPNDLITTTYRGITYTKNSDGSITCTGSVSVGYSYSEVYLYFQNSIPDGNYILSGCPSGGSESTYRAILWDSDTGARAKAWDGTTNSSSDTGSGSEVQVIASHKMGYNIIIYGSITGTLTFYPMIRFASISDSTYVPYAKTNVELTNYLSGAVVMEKVTSNDSETLGAGLGSNRIFYIDKAGYTPIGVIGFGGSGTAGISFSDIYIDTIHTAKAYYANNTSSSKTINSLFVQILYVKN